MDAESEWVRSGRRNLSYVELIALQTAGADHEALRCWIGSALFWLVATDDLLRRVEGELPSGGRYAAQRDRDEGGRTLRGLRFARNELAHGSELIVSNYGFVFPLFVDEYLDFGGRWVSPEVLRKSHGRRGFSVNKREEELYAQHVADRQPWEPIETSRQWLSGLLVGR